MTDTHFKELQKKNPFASLNDLIYEELVHQIVCQELSAGDRINEAAIAKVLQVSRSPVSAAVGRLREQGFVEKDGGKMPRVTQVSRQEYFQLMEARKAVEGQAAYLAAKRITVQELAQLKEMLGEWKQDSFESRYSQENSQFHGLIVEASHNEVLLGFYRQMQNKLLRYRYYAGARQETRELLGELYPYHYAIYQALRNRNSTQARQEIWEDIDQMCNRFW
ncbi:MAG: GntR family transcriptional regulator [Lachnospiraceae bacterium]|jgi:DNA-binding GntR family transcriptional regulator|nr:GntR family transcriptional regulator [Lachnospiraceae bacterium]MCI8995529.1 GntR family transcriptional regulator [Lachnospiraceae bacterium]MCI9132588.1 GntR family transcriptional regulator [Lachnospiraceae bacterium]